MRDVPILARDTDLADLQIFALAIHNGMEELLIVHKVSIFSFIIIT